MPNIPESKRAPSQIPHAPELPLQIVPTEKKVPTKEEVEEDRESARGVLEGDEDLEWLNSPKPPKTGKA